ncbi:uncharacterized protein LOC123505071 isoform X2 [Portunus trituberculatus]|uniref:uncharacterized protein LOC123505071 isoform X2 n=1 Tax=Portunus trituberculatus TaxID=210409 RepID=UPI001E1CC0CC|nr:uncharacterized protein LOC123505071 isoform X2 [Portunus trituberculatus]
MLACEDGSFQFTKDITAYLTRFERIATLLIDEESLAIRLGSLLTASEEELPLMRAYAVETRSSRMERVHPLVLLELQPLDVTPEDFACLQEECPSLGHKVNTGEEEWTKDGSSLLPSLLPSLYRTLKPPAKVEWRLIWLDHCLSHPQKATGTYSL